MSPHGFHRLGDTLHLQISVRPKQGQQLTITGTASHLAGTLFNITFFCPSYALAMNYKKGSQTKAVRIGCLSSLGR